MNWHGCRLRTLSCQLVSMSALLMGQVVNADDLRSLPFYQQWSTRPKDLIGDVSATERRFEYFRMVPECLKSLEGRQMLDECLNSKPNHEEVALEEVSLENLFVGPSAPDRLFEVEPSTGERRRFQLDLPPSDVQPNQSSPRESFSSGVYIWDQPPQLRPFPTVEPY